MLRRTDYAFSGERHRGAKLRNLGHSFLLLGAMLAILAACVAPLWGWEGVAWALVAGGLTLLLVPSVSPEWLLSLYRAREVHPRELPGVLRLLDALARRAGLPAAPRLFYIPSRTLNAFAVGRQDRACVAITHGLLEAMTPRELAGVLGHEVAHVKNRDLWLMTLADGVSRLTSVMSNVGLVLLVLNLPLVMAGRTTVPWLSVLVLVLAPTATSLLQLALSRAREFDADLDAARLTGDPAGLASALAKLERIQGRFWEEVILPGRRTPDASLLRTHPPSRERVRRLLGLYVPTSTLPEIGGVSATLPRHAVANLLGASGLPGAPRLRWHGLWY